MTTQTIATPAQSRDPLLVLVAVSPVAAGILTTIGAAADPAQGFEGEALWRLYAAHPAPLQIKSLALHWGYAFWFLTALAMPFLIRGRGRGLAWAAGIAGFAGMATLPGVLALDWYDSAIGQAFGVEGNAAVKAALDAMWGPPVFTAPGVISLVLALPLSALALWRAGVLPLWAVLLPVAGFAAMAVSGLAWWGAAVMTVVYAGFSALLLKRLPAETIS